MFAVIPEKIYFLCFYEQFFSSSYSKLLLEAQSFVLNCGTSGCLGFLHALSALERCQLHFSRVFQLPGL